MFLLVIFLWNIHTKKACTSSFIRRNKIGSVRKFIWILNALTSRYQAVRRRYKRKPKSKVPCVMYWVESLGPLVTHGACGTAPPRSWLPLHRSAAPRGTHPTSAILQHREKTGEEAHLTNEQASHINIQIRSKGNKRTDHFVTKFSLLHAENLQTTDARWSHFPGSRTESGRSRRVVCVFSGKKFNPRWERWKKRFPTETSRGESVKPRKTLRTAFNGTRRQSRGR